MTGTVIRGRWWRQHPHRCPCAQCKDRPAPSLPTAYYLAERERLGIPSRTADLAQPCPWCEASPGEWCYVRATGRRARQLHDARTNPVQAQETA